MSNEHPDGASSFYLDADPMGLGQPQLAAASMEAAGGDHSADVAPSLPPTAGAEDSPVKGEVFRDAVEFRVTRSGSPTRRLLLRGQRYTMGSGDACSIRLNDFAVRPMHAVLIRDASRLWIRAYSVPIEVNARRTTETTLEVGDVMRLGGYQFELLPNTNESDSSQTRCIGTTAEEGLAGDAPSRDAAIDSRPTPAESQADESAWRERLAREVQRWRTRQAECDRRDARCDQREEALRGRESDLWSRAEQLRRRETELKAQEAAALQMQQEFADKQEEVCRLREQAQARQQDFDQREAEFHRLQAAYQDQIDEASHQLRDSRQQAEDANEAVEQMREQFASLNRQLDELSEQQQALQQREQQQIEEHHQTRCELERARDQAIAQRDQADRRRTVAIEEKNEVEARRQELEIRLEEVSSACEQAQTECEAERQRANDSQTLADQLKVQVDELRESVTQARDETDQLRQSHEQASESIRQLEATAEQTHQQHLNDRESWFAEAEHLREQVEQVSLQLQQATAQLETLRDANQQLSEQLEQVQQQRDQAVAEADSRPTEQAWQSKCDQLSTANEQLAQIKNDYHDSLVALADARSAASQAATQTEAPDEADDHGDLEHGADSVTATDDQVAAADGRAGKAEDASIEAYMNRLLRRVQGESAKLRSLSNPDATAGSDSHSIPDSPSTPDSPAISELPVTPESPVISELPVGTDSSVTSDPSAVDPWAPADRPGRAEERLSFDGQDIDQAYSEPSCPEPSCPEPSCSDDPGEPADPDEPVARLADPAPPAARPVPPVALPPRSVAPEKQTNLSAMRELANESARSAITRSIHVQTRNTQIKSILKFGQALVAAGCGVAAFLFVSGWLNLVATLAALLIAAICTIEGMGLLRDARRRLEGTREELPKNNV